MPINFEELEKRIKNGLEASGDGASGQVEILQSRVDRLEEAVAHLMAFIAEKMRLTEDEIENENGLRDF